MSFRVHREGELEYLTSDVLDGAAHCFSTRFGGVSEGALASLNLGTHRGDRPENVLENYARLGRAVGFAPEETVFTKQVHSALVERVGRADCGRGLQREAEHGVDGLVTDEPGVALTIFSADCTPVLLFDPIARAIGAAHAGWRGTAAGIAARAVEAMQREFGCRPENIRAAIGPCIGPCCFETDADVPDAMRAALGSEAGQAIRLAENDAACVRKTQCLPVFPCRTDASLPEGAVDGLAALARDEPHRDLGAAVEKARALIAHAAVEHLDKAAVLAGVVRPVDFIVIDPAATGGKRLAAPQADLSRDHAHSSIWYGSPARDCLFIFCLLYALA